MWYCAHGIFYFEYKYEEQDSYLVYENVYIINADDEESALNESIRIAKENEDFNEDDHLELNGKPVRYLFSGIRKLIRVENASAADEGAINSGVEVTYSELEVENLNQVKELSDGSFVEVLYRE